MTKRTGYNDGEPCWVDVTTSDLSASREFYGGLFGWDFEVTGPEFGGYVNALIDGDRVAGLTPPPPGAEGMPSTWNTYFASSDAARTYRQAEAAGAKILFPPMEVPTQGTMLGAIDPTGAAFGIWQPGGHLGAVRVDEPGAMCWVELWTRDGAAADAFYASLFPYEQTQIGDGRHFDYTRWTFGDAPITGRKVDAEAPPHWKVYFTVADVDAAVDQVRTLGGTVESEPQRTEYGSHAFVADHAGAAFTLMQRPTP